jgi:hypothetical protein
MPDMKEGVMVTGPAEPKSSRLKELALVCGATSEPTVSPFARIQAIAAVYFPHFDSLIQELDNKTAGYRVWIDTANFTRASGKLHKLPDGLREAMDPYIAARDKLMDGLKKFAHTHFQ